MPDQISSLEQRPNPFGLTSQEYERLLVMQKLVRKDVTPKQAAQQLRLCPRQVRVLQRRYLDLGAQGLISGKRGKPSNRSISADVRLKAIRIIRDRYAQLGPTRVCQHLAKRHAISVCPSTINSWMVDAGLWQGRSGSALPMARRQNHDKCNRIPMGRFIPLFDEWVLDNQDLVAASNGSKGVKKLRLIWHNGAINWCEKSGHLGGKQLQAVLDAVRRELCPDAIGSPYWYVPERRFRIANTWKKRAFESETQTQLRGSKNSAI